VLEGFDRYRAIGGPGWRPPTVAEVHERLVQRLGAAEVWCLVAESSGSPVGHGAFLPTTLASRPGPEPGLAHLWQLFVRPPFWGTGIASRLLAEATRAAARDFQAMRLHTPAAQLRARRFYEREGFGVHDGPADDLDFGMPLVEYRRALI